MKHDLLIKTRRIIHTFIFVSLTAAISACGANPFKSFEEKDPAEDATVALEEGKPTKAINILTKALQDDPGNAKYISILALAYAERAGINALTLAQKMASNSESNSSSSGVSSSSTHGVTSLFSIMPAATDANIADVDTAVNLMLSISSDARTAADILKIAMYETAAMTLRTKKYDLDGDGTISAAEALAMSSADALTILSQISGAASAFSGNSSSSSVDQAAASQITNIQSAISQCPGGDQETQLKNYMSKNGC
jgi:hypothetical protein